MKRTNPYEANRQRAAKRRTQRQIARRYGFLPPRVTYAGSMVPARTGGYRPNRTERKVNDLTTATYQANTTGSIVLLANPVLGSDFNQRIGRKIILKSVYIRGYISQEGADAASIGIFAGTQLARLIIFADMQPNGASPALTDLLVEATSCSQLNLNNRDRFKIYCDKQFVLDPYLVTTTVQQSLGCASNQGRPVKKYKKLNLEMIFNATNGGTIADINSGALYMCWVGNRAAGVGTDCQARVSTRVRYADA